MPALMRTVGVLWRCSNLYRGMRFESMGLAGIHHTYLLTICEDPGISQEKLAERIFVHKSNVARQLAVLQERGFVERKSDPEDRRVLRIYPTQKAYEVLPQIRLVLKEWETEVFQALNPQERELFAKWCDRLSDRAKDLLRRETEQER